MVLSHYGTTILCLSGLITVQILAMFRKPLMISINKFTICDETGNTKGGSITVLLTTCLTGLESAV